MKSLLNTKDREDILLRLHRLSPASTRLWGVMSVNQAIVHVTDPFRDALGERSTRRVVPALLAFFIKKMALTDKPFRKGTATVRTYDQVKGTGTAPTTFSADMQALLDRIERFSDAGDAELGPHPGLGSLSRDEWGRLLYKEIDHHLRQFGV